MTLEQLERLETLTGSNHHLRVQRCRGHHCIEIKPDHEDTDQSYRSIKAICDGVASGQWPGLKLHNHYTRNMYDIIVCIDMAAILSDTIRNHHLGSQPYED